MPLVVSVDSASVRIVTSDPYSSDAQCAIDAEPTLVIGDREDDPAHLLAAVTAGARLSDGSVAILERAASEVRVFDSTGGHLRTLGGVGDGPGEFKNGYGIWIRPGDTLWAGDYRPWRYNVFAPDGRWVRTVAMDPSYFNASWFGGVLADGGLITARGTKPIRSFQTPDTLVVEAHSVDGRLEGVLARLPDSRTDLLSDGPTSVWIAPLFDSRALAVARGDRIAIATTDKPEIRILDSEYKLTTIVRWQAGDRTIANADVAAYRENERFRDDRVSPKRPVADQFPAFTAMLMGTGGHLWVFRYPRPRGDVKRDALVFAPTGEFSCHVEAKGGWTILEAGPDYILAVQLDEWDTPTVELRGFNAGAALVP